MGKTLVIYDSMYGNTEKIAQAIVEGMGPAVQAAVRRAGDVTPEEVREADLLVIGSPTQGFRPTKAVTDIFRRIGPRGLGRARAAAFDTRFEVEKLTSAALRVLVKTGGFAAPRLGQALKKAGASVILAPEGFYVEDTEGPLKPGEVERAVAWGRRVIEAAGR